MNRSLIRTAILGCACVAAGVAGFLAPGLRPGPQGANAGTGGPATVAPGYQLRLVTRQLTAPVAAAADAAGTVYVAEAGRKTGTPPRVVRLRPGGGYDTVAADFPAPLTGLTWQGNNLLVSYAGGVDVLNPNTGVHHPVLKDLPAGGDYPNNQALTGPDGKLYFGIGSATNAGVVGPDNIARGWVTANPAVHDIPCKPVRLRGQNFTAPNPLTPDPHDTAATGAFSPFGKPSARLQTMPGDSPCTGAVLSAAPDGTGLTMIAWGLRNPLGLAFSPDGHLFATVQGYESRGSRPVVQDHDYLYRIDVDRWYGWPDFAGGRSITSEQFQQPGTPLSPLLADPPEQPPLPAATFAPHSGAAGLLFPPAAFGLRDEALVALTGQGDHGEGTPRGAVVRVNLTSGAVTPVVQAPEVTAANPETLQHPFGLAATPAGSVLVVDLGQTRQTPAGPEPTPGTGALWLLERSASPTTDSGPATMNWRWALIGLVLSISGTQLLRERRG